jgi:23S rRNA (cytidine2498-2'-O)-methyltransferase
MPEQPTFVFATCQVGAETALKNEADEVCPWLRFAYSRPGFLTFKISDGRALPDSFSLDCIFARTSGLSVGKVTGGKAAGASAAETSMAEMSAATWELVRGRDVQGLHVFERDRYAPGEHDFDPGITPAAREVERALRADSHSPLGSDAGNPEAPSAGQLIVDVVIVAEDEWWIGVHRIGSITSAWPGGFFPEELPADAVSRVYLKVREAIVWSGFEMKPGQKCVEIGCAPGGASQALLRQGLFVAGVDPAEMHPALLAEPRFRHIRRRSKEVPRREFVGVDWITCDINLPPNYTLDTVEAIVTYPGVKLKGALLTLKLAEWQLAEQIPAYLARLRSLGFENLRARQLHHDRREICVSACGGQA